jgi:U3 small nucleolar RNA-associated protein 12
MRLIAVSLLDMTVKIFFEDSLKLSLSLYGHKLPVNALEIASDNTTIVTVSNDKNIKIWNLQFGDCRKSIFAHQDGITGISFLGRSSEFVTISKDKTIRYWDASKYQALQKIVGHQSEVWCLAASHIGDFIATAAHDKSIRIWRKTDELLFPEEEKEREMEEIMDASMLNENPHEKEEGEEVGQASKATISSMKAAERLVEAIEVADIETQKALDRKTVRIIS